VPKNPANHNIENIPTLYRESFQALRGGDDPPGKTFGLATIELNGNPQVAIVHVAYNPNTGAIESFYPLFVAYPHSVLELASYEALDENHSFKLN
jgi:hypothetical protein